MNWYIWTGSEVVGPGTEANLVDGLRSGKHTGATLVSQSPAGPWTEARMVLAFSAALQTKPVKTSSAKILGAIVGVMVLPGLACLLPGLLSRGARSNPLTAGTSSAAPPSGPRWTYHDSHDEMRGTTRHVGCLSSTNHVEFQFP